MRHFGKKRSLFGISGIVVIATVAMAASARAENNGVWVEQLDLSEMRQSCFDKPGVRQSVSGKTLSVAGKSYEHGVGTHAPSEVSFELGGRGLRFSASVGVDDAKKNKAHPVFAYLHHNHRISNDL
jgi:alpha-galactosidase